MSDEAKDRAPGKAEPKPIGDRVIGLVDPRTLPREEFAKSPDLLFHGSAKPLIYRSAYDYDSNEYHEEGDGSQTIGTGFYTTDDRKAAESYSLVRQGRYDAPPIVLEVLPSQAKVLDLRASTDLLKNAPLPKDLFDKWFQFFKGFYFNKEKIKGTERYAKWMEKEEFWHIRNIFGDYFQFLIRARDLNKDLDLRVVLDTAPYPGLGGNHYPHPPYVYLFSEFMRQQGYDGLVYNEGGEGPKAESHASYVFFNLDKIGTYESWHSASATP